MENFSISSAMQHGGMPTQVLLFLSDERIGFGSYPGSIPSYPGPHVTCRYYFYIYFMCIQYERGGWFSSDWDSTVNVGSGRFVTGKQLPDGNLVFHRYNY